MTFFSVPTLFSCTYSVDGKTTKLELVEACKKNMYESNPISTPDSIVTMYCRCSTERLLKNYTVLEIAKSNWNPNSKERKEITELLEPCRQDYMKKLKKHFKDQGEEVFIVSPK
jgi:hypothetical protein